jgi:hypothetical protein
VCGNGKKRRFDLLSLDDGRFSIGGRKFRNLIFEIFSGREFFGSVYGIVVLGLKSVVFYLIFLDFVFFGNEIGKKVF